MILLMTGLLITIKKWWRELEIKYQDIAIWAKHKLNNTMTKILKFVITAKYFVLSYFLSNAENGLGMIKNGKILISSL
jgi:hypothetical protein